MKTVEIKRELHEIIDKVDSAQVRQIYDMILNHFNGPDDDDEWDRLSKHQQEQINIGLAQADAGLGRPFEEVTKEIREKYGL